MDMYGTGTKKMLNMLILDILKEYSDSEHRLLQQDIIDLFEDIKDFIKISVDGCNFALMHYPMLSWPKMRSGGYQLHGHIHARMEYNEANRAEGIRRYDVGVDANNFFPVSVKQIVDFFGEQVNVDDHNILFYLDICPGLFTQFHERVIVHGIQICPKTVSRIMLFTAN